MVATEVRSLAQHSASVAREIKTLITGLVERVSNGTQQVAHAGAAIHQVVASIRQVTGWVADNTSASREQSSGMSQVDAASTQLDRNIQQNAALVEPSSAAANSLNQQGQTLVVAMSQFKPAA